MRRRIAFLSAAVGILAVCATQFASALPPGGVKEEPGTPPGELTVTTPEGPENGQVKFCVNNIRVDDKDKGPVAQQFYLKFDEHGNGIGPFTPDRNGQLCDDISTDRRDYADGPRDSKQPYQKPTSTESENYHPLPAALCDPAQRHVLRLLSGPWGAEGSNPAASERSISAQFSVAAGGTCGNTRGSDSPPPPPPGGPGSPGGGGSARPGGRGQKGSPPVRLGSKQITVKGKALSLRLTSGAEFVMGRAVLRTRGKVKVGRARPTVRTVAKRGFQIASDDTATVRLRLTEAGRVLTRKRKRLAAELTLTARGRTVGKEDVVIRSDGKQKAGKKGPGKQKAGRRKKRAAAR